MHKLEEKDHIEGLKKSFLVEGPGVLADETILSVLMTYAASLKQAQDLARKLIAKFGGLSNILSASPQDLCAIDGIESDHVTLIKLVNFIRSRCSQSVQHGAASEPLMEQGSLFAAGPDRKVSRGDNHQHEPNPSLRRRQGTGFFGKAVLREAIQVLPSLPPHGSIDEIKRLVKRNLHFSAEQTRRRNTDYIVRRMFPNNTVDPALILFARKYAGSQELREVCFYRFCIAEPIMFRFIEEVLLPSIGKGMILRDSINQYIADLLPSSKSIKDYAHAIIDAMAAGGIIKAERTRIAFGYREIPSASYAFILHSEFRSSGMYDIAKIENNSRIRILLWNPDRLLPALYELRNRGIISKISEIDSTRQFTTKWTLSEVIDNLPGSGTSR